MMQERAAQVWRQSASKSRDAGLVGHFDTCEVPNLVRFLEIDWLGMHRDPGPERCNCFKHPYKRDKRCCQVGFIK